MRKHRMNLSALASAVSKVMRDTAQDYEVTRAMHAPSECYASVDLYHERALTRAFRVAGWTRQEYNRALVDRTTERWAWVSGLTVNEEPHLDGRGRLRRCPRQRRVRDEMHAKFMRRVDAHYAAQGSRPAEVYA